MSKKHHIGIFPGTFDPITFGHLDIIQRAAPLVDKLIVAVATNIGKEPLFPIEMRLEMIEEELKNLPQLKGFEIVAKPFDNLLVDFARDEGAGVIVRGLRAVSDFEYEFQMAGTNRKLNPDIETVFLVASESFQLIASHLVKEIARLKGDTTPFVSKKIASRLEAKFSN